MVKAGLELHTQKIRGLTIALFLWSLVWFGPTLDAYGAMSKLGRKKYHLEVLSFHQTNYGLHTEMATHWRLKLNIK